LRKENLDIDLKFLRTMTSKILNVLVLGLVFNSTLASQFNTLDKEESKKLILKDANMSQDNIRLGNIQLEDAQFFISVQSDIAELFMDMVETDVFKVTREAFESFKTVYDSERIIIDKTLVLKKAKEDDFLTEIAEIKREFKQKEDLGKK